MTSHDYILVMTVVTRYLVISILEKHAEEYI